MVPSSAKSNWAYENIGYTPKLESRQRWVWQKQTIGPMMQWHKFVQNPPCTHDCKFIHALTVTKMSTWLKNRNEILVNSVVPCIRKGTINRSLVVRPPYLPKQWWSSGKVMNLHCLSSYFCSLSSLKDIKNVKNLSSTLASYFHHNLTRIPYFETKRYSNSNQLVILTVKSSKRNLAKLDLES